MQPARPQGRVCRYSDAARAQYSIPRTHAALGRIARTTGPDPLVAEYGSATFPPNLEVNKVGRTTGWTSGKVSATCANVNIEVNRSDRPEQPCQAAQPGQTS